MPTPDDVKARVASAYNRAADSYDHPSNAFWDRFGRRTVERLGVAPGSRVLDLCCGTGASALPAAEAAGEGGQVVAVDLATELVRLGREKASRLGLRNIEFRVADMLGLDPGPDGFDCVICVFGVFFVPDMAGALRQMGSFLRPAGRVAVTTWGKGLFEPVNSMFWESVRRSRPELYKSFNPWDRVGDPTALLRLFTEAGLPAPEVEVERATHPLKDENDALALMMGTGYRGVMEQLSETERSRVRKDVLEQIHAERVMEVRADVIYAVSTKHDRHAAPA